MRRTSALAVTLALLSPGLAGAGAQPPAVMPFFSSTVAGPAFFAECRNDSKEAVSSGAPRWLSALRIDGNVLPDDRGRIGPGLTTMVQPGEVWRGIVVLRQDGTGYFPAVKFGALVRMSRVTPLAEGRHTFAVRCGDIWSDESTFFWENERQQLPPKSAG